MEGSLKIGIIGLGFLGGSMNRYFTEKGLNPFRYDKKGAGSPDEVNRADIIFVCVNTPYSAKTGNIDLSFVESALGAINNGKIAVIRSTVPPGTTEGFQKKFPDLKIMFNPEFLRARFAYDDFINPPRQIIGVTEKSGENAEAVMNLLPMAPDEFTKILPAKSAEIIKYAANTMLAVKVALANKFFEISEAVGADFDDIKHLISADQRIGPWGLDVWYEGFRGYSGTCFPKDVRTLIAQVKPLGVDMKWIEVLDNENLALLKSQGLEPDYGYPKTV